MPTFSHREKNVTISVRCGARCRAYHASSMGEGKGPPHNCAPARFLFFGFFNSMESAFPYEESFSVRPNPVLRRLGRGASPSANPHSFVRKHHAYRPVRASGDPDVVLHCPQSLISSSGSTTPPGPDFPGPPAPQLASPSPQNLNSSSGHANLARIFSVRRRLCWRRPPCKTLTLRRTTPTWSGFSRPAGASVGVALPAKPYSSGRTWCLTLCKPFFLRPEAPRP